MCKTDTGNNLKINDVEVTSDTLTSRGGLAFFSRYLDEINVGQRLDTLFGSVRKHNKGITVKEALHQALCYFMDGTCLSLAHFDRLAEEEGYARTIGRDPDDMASSDQMKRFWTNFSFRNNHQFRRMLQDLLIWQINQNQPELIRLDLDTQVLDNDCAEHREGAQPTYKNVKGYKPLLLKYNGRVIDFVFRGGAKHCNHGQTVVKMIRHITERIRTEYDRGVPILLTADNAFFDQKNFRAFEQLGIGYVVGGKTFEGVVENAENQSEEEWETVKKEYMSEARGKAEYKMTSFQDSRTCWEKSRRALFCRLVSSDGQRQLGLRERVYYTNLGVDEEVTEQVITAGEQEWLGKAGLLELAHSRGKSELVHRCLNEFGTEHLPFKSFEANHAFYGTMLVAYSLYCSFCEQVTGEVISEECYPSTFRRRFLDIAGKIVKHSGAVILKVTEAVYERLELEQVWQKANSPPIAPVC